MALGKTRDRKVFETLREFLKAGEHVTAGFAAEALGHLGFADGEPLLIDALASDNTWLQVNACQGLSLIGTRQAIPALERLANDNSYTGALSRREMAQRAIESINARSE
jgi:HEAT repeat protein